jgi:hypothetical protein
MFRVSAVNFAPNRVYDQKNAEVVDIYNGEVEEDHIFATRPTIRASDYAEWEQKRQHAILLSDRDRRLWVAVWNVGERIGAPKWLREEVFWFYKKARALKTRPEFKGIGLHVNKEKYVLVVYYVIARKRGLLSFAEQIASMPCNASGEPCYVNRKKGDKEFKKFLKIVLRYASVIYPNNYVRDPVTIIDNLMRQEYNLIPEIVYRRAKEIAVKIQPQMGGRKTNTVVAACVKIALDELMPEKAKPLFSYICSVLKVSELSVKNFIEHLRSTGVLKDV